MITKNIVCSTTLTSNCLNIMSNLLKLHNDSQQDILNENTLFNDTSLVVAQLNGLFQNIDNTYLKNKSGYDISIDIKLFDLLKATLDIEKITIINIISLQDPDNYIVAPTNTLYNYSRNNISILIALLINKISVSPNLNISNSSDASYSALQDLLSIENLSTRAMTNSATQHAISCEQIKQALQTLISYEVQTKSGSTVDIFANVNADLNNGWHNITSLLPGCGKGDSYCLTLPLDSSTTLSPEEEQFQSSYEQSNGELRRHLTDSSLNVPTIPYQKYSTASLDDFNDTVPILPNPTPGGSNDYRAQCKAPNFPFIDFSNSKGMNPTYYADSTSIASLASSFALGASSFYVATSVFDSIFGNDFSNPAKLKVQLAVLGFHWAYNLARIGVTICPDFDPVNIIGVGSLNAFVAAYTTAQYCSANNYSGTYCVLPKLIKRMYRTISRATTTTTTTIEVSIELTEVFIVRNN